MVDVPEHESEIPRLPEAELGCFRLGLRQRRLRKNERELGGELARAEAGLVKALAARRTPVEHVEMLAFAVVRAGALGQLEMCLDDISHVREQRCRMLLAIFFDKQS